MDFHSKKIIGLAYGTSITAELAIKVVENACLKVSNTTGIILHSDLGSHSTQTNPSSATWQKRKSIIHSVGKAALTTMHALSHFILSSRKKKYIVRLIKIQQLLIIASLNISNLGIIVKGFTVA